MCIIQKDTAALLFHSFRNFNESSPRLAAAAPAGKAATLACPRRVQFIFDYHVLHPRQQSCRGRNSDTTGRDTQTHERHGPVDEDACWPHQVNIAHLEIADHRFHCFEQCRQSWCILASLRLGVDYVLGLVVAIAAQVVAALCATGIGVYADGDGLVATVHRQNGRSYPAPSPWVSQGGVYVEPPCTACIALARSAWVLA